MSASTEILSFAETDIKPEIIQLEAIVEKLYMEKREEVLIKDDPDEMETKNAITQDYLDLGDTVVGELNIAVHDVATIPDIKQEMLDLEETIEDLFEEDKEELHIKDDTDEEEIKYVNTQDYLDIGETVVGELNGAVPDVSTSSETGYPLLEHNYSIKRHYDHTYCRDRTSTAITGDQQQIFKTRNLKKDVNGKFKCELCDYRSNRGGTLKRHIRTHSGEKPFQCELCDYRCNRGECLKTHMRTHSGEKPFECELCDYRCSQKPNLRKHMRTHSEDKLFQCELCDYRCKQKQDLKPHMRTHSEEKLFQCELCNYRCKQKPDLKTHMITHSVEKPFRCELCDYRCKWKQCLKTHMRTHSGKKPFQCELCDYRSNQNPNLKTHMRTHSEEKLFQCELCDYRCNQKQHLNRHMTTHSGEKSF